MLDAPSVPSFRSLQAIAFAIAIPGAALLGVASALFPSTLLLYAALVALIAACFVNWRLGVYAILVVTVVEGYVRLRLGNPQVLLVKDAMLAAVYMRIVAGNILHGRRLIPPSFLNAPLAAFTAIVLVEAFNPNIAAPSEALIGIRTWLWYVPLFYVGIEMARSTDARPRFQSVLVVTTIVAAMIAAAQYAAGPAAYAAQGDAFRIATFVTGVTDSAAVVYRPNSTFAWSSHFAVFLAIGTVFAVALAMKSRGWSRVAAVCSFIFLAGINVVEGQRVMYLLLPIVIVAMFVLAGRMRGKLRLIAAIPIAIGLLALATPFLPPQLGVLDRPLALFGAERDTIAIRAETYSVTTINAILKFPLGAGTGATSLGSRYVLGDVPLFIEFPTGKVAGDLSLLGLALYAWVFVSLIRFALRAVQSARTALDSGGAADATALLATVILIIFTGYDLAIAAVTFWLLAGLFAGSYARASSTVSVVRKSPNLGADVVTSPSG
jgi:hypothetical protein